MNEKDGCLRRSRRANYVHDAHDFDVDLVADQALNANPAPFGIVFSSGARFENAVR
jgi:hypothetical protein